MLLSTSASERWDSCQSFGIHYRSYSFPPPTGSLQQAGCRSPTDERGTKVWPSSPDEENPELSQKPVCRQLTDGQQCEIAGRVHDTNQSSSSTTSHSSSSFGCRGSRSKPTHLCIPTLPTGYRLVFTASRRHWKAIASPGHLRTTQIVHVGQRDPTTDRRHRSLRNLFVSLDRSPTRPSFSVENHY